MLTDKKGCRTDVRQPQLSINLFFEGFALELPPKEHVPWEFLTLQMPRPRAFVEYVLRAVTALSGVWGGALT